jgi:hypothetical protein
LHIEEGEAVIGEVIKYLGCSGQYLKGEKSIEESKEI